MMFVQTTFVDYSFLVHNPVSWDNWHLLAHAMASDFTVTWQSKIVSFGGFLQTNTR
jgi:hypothetical protein